MSDFTSVAASGVMEGDEKLSRVTGDRVLFIDVFNASDFANSLVANSDIIDESEVDGKGNFDMICAKYKTVVVGDSYANESGGSWLSEYYKRGGRVVIIAWMGIYKIRIKIHWFLLLIILSLGCRGRPPLPVVRTAS